MPPMSYSHVAEAVFLRPWAIQRPVHATIRNVLAEHVRRGHLAVDEIQARLEAATPRRGDPATAPVNVAVIPIRGTIMPRANLMSMMFGGTSIEQLRRDFRGALANDEIEAIVFDIESPGGLVDGVPEFSAELRAARGQKPIVGSVNHYAASAAYWMLAQMDTIFVTMSGDVGSIGVFTAHEDWSKFWEETGVTTTLINAGKYKVEGNEFEPLADDAKDYIQGRVDEFYGMFVNDVAKGRGVSASTVREGFGQGRMVLAKAAVAEGMADKIGTLEDAIAFAGKQGALNRRQRDQQAGGGAPWIAAVALDESPRNLEAEWGAGLEGWFRAEAGQPPADQDGPDPAPDPDADDGEQPTDDGDKDEATGPEADFYAVRARRRDREATR